jgi:hypothetical protein
LKSVEQTQIVAVESLHVLEHSTADDARQRGISGDTSWDSVCGADNLTSIKDGRVPQRKRPLR